MKDASVLVSGGAGFIGSHLIDALREFDCKISVIETPSPSLEALQKRHSLASLDSFDSVQLDQFDFIFHLAGSAYVPFSVENPYKDFQLNVEDTMRLLEQLKSAANRPKIIFPSSAAVYGNPATMPIRESDPTVPVSPYGVSKLAAERYISVYCRLYGLRAVSLRLFSVYGPCQKKQVVYDLFAKLREQSGKIELHGDGSQTRDFIHVKDVVNAMVLSAVSPIEDGRAYNIASGNSIRIDELANSICKSLSLNPEITYLGHNRPGDVEKWYVDVSKAESEIGFKSSISLDQGIESVKDWLNHRPECTVKSSSEQR